MHRSTFLSQPYCVGLDNMVMHDPTMRTANQRETPLAVWLRENKVTQEQFGNLLCAIRGWGMPQSQISRWVNGVATPSRSSRRDIEMATSRLGRPVKAMVWG